MKPFKVPLEDILFSLNHVAGANDLVYWDADLPPESDRTSPPSPKGKLP